MASNFKPRYAVFQKEKKKKQLIAMVPCAAELTLVRLCLKYEIPTSCLKKWPSVRSCLCVSALLNVSNKA